MNSPSRVSRAAIIGGGIFGVSSAVQLARRGARVTLVTREPSRAKPPAARFPG